MRAGLGCICWHQPPDVRCVKSIAVRSWQVAQATLDAVVPSDVSSSLPPTSQDVSSGNARAAVHTTTPQSMPARKQPGSAAGASYREQLEAQPPHSAGAAGAGDGAGLHQHRSISPAAIAAQGPTAAPQHGHGVPRTVSSVFQTPPAFSGAPPTMQSEQQSASVPGSGPGLTQAQSGPVLQAAQDEDEHTPAADAASRLSSSKPSADAVVADAATASDNGAMSGTAGPQPAAMAAALEAEVDEPDAPADDLVDDDLPELPEGYSYLGRRMVRAVLRVRLGLKLRLCQSRLRSGLGLGVHLCVPSVYDGSQTPHMVQTVKFCCYISLASSAQLLYSCISRSSRFDW